MKGRKAGKKEKRKEYVAKKYNMIPFIRNFADITLVHLCVQRCAKRYLRQWSAEMLINITPSRFFFSLILLLCCLVIPDEDVLYQ